MSKSKGTKVPLPGSATTPKKRKDTASASSKAAFKSHEYVGSSDDSAGEGASPAATREKPTKPKSPAKIGIHRPNGVSKATKIAPPKPKAPPKKVVIQELDSSSESDNDESAKSQKDLPQKKGVENTEVNAKATASDGEASSDSSDSSSADSDGGSVPTTKPTEQAHNQTQPVQQSHTVEFRPAQPYVPPKGFNAVPTPLKPTSEAVKLFDDLEGKQVWHFSAPAGISITQLERLAMDKALKGGREGAILKHKGSDYGLVRLQSSEEPSRAVLVPRRDGYEPVSVPIAQTFHVQEIIELPNITTKQADPNTGSEAAASITRSTIRAPRPQVKGLKMRYFHSGFGDQEAGIIGMSDSENETAVPVAGLGIPDGGQFLNKPEKRKHYDVNGAAGSESPVKKHKKHRTPEEIKRKDEKRAKKDRKREKESTKAKS